MSRRELLKEVQVLTDALMVLETGREFAQRDLRKVYIYHSNLLLQARTLWLLWGHKCFGGKLHPE
jgi:hypothetical protein